MGYSKKASGRFPTDEEVLATLGCGLAKDKVRTDVDTWLNSMD
jgi:hypothetical protein